MGAIDATSAPGIPERAAVVAAEAENVGELKRRYRAEGRPVALVHADGTVSVVKDSHGLGWLVVAGGALLVVWNAVRSRVRIPA